jgi:TPP-dependent 2-oxoacid decarboxylase
LPEDFPNRTHYDAIIAGLKFRGEAQAGTGKHRGMKPKATDRRPVSGTGCEDDGFFIRIFETGDFNALPAMALIAARRRIMAAMTTVADYLVGRLEQAGVRHVFGVPGDYVLDFKDRIVESPLELVNTCNELNAGYAADGYARIRGISAVVVTYGVGGLSALNAVAGAYAERVPMVVISGAPHSKLWHDCVIMHHLVENYQTQINAFRQVTACAEILTDACRAPEQIDRAVKTCLRTKRPVYIEIPADLVGQQCSGSPAAFNDEVHRSNPEALAEALAKASSMLAGALRPAVFIGMEVRRFRLLRQVTALLEKSGYPVATTIGGKTAIAMKSLGIRATMPGGMFHPASTSAAYNVGLIQRP